MNAFFLRAIALSSNVGYDQCFLNLEITWVLSHSQGVRLKQFKARVGLMVKIVRGWEVSHIFLGEQDFSE